MLTVPLNVWCFYICHVVAFSSVIFKLGGNFKQLLGLRDAPEFRGSLSEIIRIFWLFLWRKRFWNSGSSDSFWNKYLLWTWDYPEFRLTFRQSELVLQYPFCNLENFRFPFNLKLTRNSSWRTFFPDHYISKMEFSRNLIATLVGMFIYSNFQIKPT